MRAGAMLIAACLVTASITWSERTDAQTARAPVSSDTSIPLLPAHEIPVYKPGNSDDNHESAKLDPLATAARLPSAAPTPCPTTSQPAATTTTPVTTTTTAPPRSTTPRPGTSAPSPTTRTTRTTRPPVLDSNFFVPTPTTASIEGKECGENYKYGSAAVSVLGTGTFCSEMPVCSGIVNGSCPGVQPGLPKAARCALLPESGTVYGCLP